MEISPNHIERLLTVSSPAEEPQDFPIEIKKVKETYTLVFHQITIKYNLDPLKSILLSTIHSLSKKYQYCDASQKTFAELLGVCIPTIKSALDELEGAGLIERLSGKSHWGTFKWAVAGQVKADIEQLRQKLFPPKRT